MTIRARYFVVCAAAFVAVLVFAALFNQTLSTRTLRMCAAIPSEQLAKSCEEYVVRRVLARDGAAAILSSLRNTHPSLKSCHSYAHMIGGELFHSNGSVERSIQECSSTCGSGCYHGVIAAAFISVPGLKAAPEEVMHPTIDLITREGARLCSSWETCHGVGHVLFQLTESLVQSLALCDAVGQPLSYVDCRWGVFMESSGWGGGTYEGVRDANDLLSPCTSVPDVYQASCYHLLFIHQNMTFEERGIQDTMERHRLRVDACHALTKSSVRDACAEGVGYAVFSGGLEINEARKICALFSDEREEGSCLFGYTHVFLDERAATDALHACAVVERSVAKRACYQGAFRALGTDRAERLSRSCDGITDAQCAEDLAAYMRNPTELVFSYFASSNNPDVQ